MTVEELIKVLQQVDDKSLPVVFTDWTYGESIVTEVKAEALVSYDGSLKDTVHLISLDGL